MLDLNLNFVFRNQKKLVHEEEETLNQNMSNWENQDTKLRFYNKIPTFINKGTFVILSINLWTKWIS